MQFLTSAESAPNFRGSADPLTRPSRVPAFVVSYSGSCMSETDVKQLTFWMIFIADSDC